MPVDYSLGPKRRVKHRQDFLRIQKEGRKFRAAHFLLSVSQRRNDASDSRIGITITTKVHKRAVRRNLLKRRVREIFRANRARLKFALDLVVIALNGSTELEFVQVKEEILGALEKGRLLR